MDKTFYSMARSQHECGGDDSCLCEACENGRLDDMQLQMHIVAGWQVTHAIEHMQKYCLKRPMRDSALTGSKWVWELCCGHDRRFFQAMRMRKPVFHQLLADLVNHGKMPSKPKHVSLEESLAIFLQIVGHGLIYTVIEERLHHSSETISNHFHMVLDAVSKLVFYITRPTDPSFSNESPEVEGNPLYWPYFKGCVGAIDGTHIGLRIPEHEKIRWMNRKSVCTTNVLAIVDFNMRIIFATVGMEGSMHDSRVLTESMRDARRNFPMPPDGKYYVADAGYPLMKGFLTPYRNTRYHLGSFREDPVMRNKKEKFNYRHSSLRTIVERTFGVLKKRWRVLNTMSDVKVDDQIKIIWACICLHNYIRIHNSGDVDQLGYIPPHDENLSSRLRTQETSQWMRVAREETEDMEVFRNNIRDMIP